MNTVLGTASGARNIGTNGAIAVGGYIALAGLWAAPISGASMNPVRSLAPDLVRGDFTAAWIYLVGPFAGALIGVGFEWILKGPPTTPARSRRRARWKAIHKRGNARLAMRSSRIQPGFALSRFAVAVSAAARRRLVGGDGLEPPTPSV